MTASLRPSSPSTSRRQTSTRASRAPSRRCSGTPLMPSATRRPSVRRCWPHRPTRRSHARPPPKPSCSSRTSPSPAAPSCPSTLAWRRVAVLGHLADERNLGDGGSSDVYAPSVVTVLEGLRAALPHAEVVHADGSDLAAAAASAASADVAIVVVGYTRADEGEFIGDSGTTHLRSLLPGPDEPDVVAAFEARLPSDRPGDRGIHPRQRRARLLHRWRPRAPHAPRRRRAADRERRHRQPADRRLPRGGERRADRSVASPCPRPRPDLVLGDAGWTRHR